MHSLADVVESYYLETQDGLFFAVKGLEHPPDRVIAVVRYVRTPGGQREKNGARYQRLYQFDDQEQLLRSSFPQYLEFDPVFQTTLQSVPISRIQHMYDPRLRVRELSENPAVDGVEADALAFARLLQSESAIPLSAIGISGSLLIGLHLDSSDLDISIFGAGNCVKAYEALGRMRNPRSLSGVSRLDEPGIEELYRQRASDTPVPFDVFADRESDKLCQGSFRRRPYFIRFIKNAHEVREKYGDCQYTALGRSTIRATVADSRERIFTPCRYDISDVQIVEGPQLPIAEVVSFRGRFCEQVRTGELIRASGTVERLEHKSGEIRYRLLLGSSAGDTMRTERNGI